MRPRRGYPTDLTDRVWAILEPLAPASKPGRRPCRWPRRELLSAMFYLMRSGEAWRLLPHDLPPWQTVYHYFHLWCRDGTWERIHTRRREETRRRMGRDPTSSGAIIDSQSVKTTEIGGLWRPTTMMRARR